MINEHTDQRTFEPKSSNTLERTVENVYGLQSRSRFKIKITTVYKHATSFSNFFKIRNRLALIVFF